MKNSFHFSIFIPIENTLSIFIFNFDLYLYFYTLQTQIIIKLQQLKQEMK